MRFGIDHPLEGLIVVVLVDDVADRIHVACALIRVNNGVTNCPNKTGPPLGVETGPACAHSLSNPLVVFHVLGNRDLPRLPLCDEGIDPLHETPTIRDVIGGVVVLVVDIADRTHRIPAQAIGKALFQPTKRIVQ